MSLPLPLGVNRTQRCSVTFTALFAYSVCRPVVKVPSVRSGHYVMGPYILPECCFHSSLKFHNA